MGAPIYVLKEEESKRINILKFIAIVFVVYVHSATTTPNFADAKGALDLSKWVSTYEFYIADIIGQCSVPLFLLSSSVFFFSKERKYADVLKTKSKTLLIPYLFWNSFWIAVWAVLQEIPFTAPFFSGDNTNILDCNLTEWLGLYGIGRIFPQDYPLWFMRDLLVLFLIFPILKKIIFEMPNLSLAIGVALTFSPYFPLQVALSWFIIGGVIVKKDLHLTSIDKIPFKLLAAVYVVSSILVLVLSNKISDVLFVYIGIVFWIRVSKIIYENEKIKGAFIFLSQWTFIIFVFHELTLSSIKKVCMRFLPLSDISLCLQYTLIPVLVMGICIFVGMTMSNLCPGFYALITGGRNQKKKNKNTGSLNLKA